MYMEQQQAPIVEPKGNSGPTKKGFSRKLKDETIRDLKKNIFNKGAKRALPSSSETDACSDDEDGYVCILKYRILQRKLRERERELEQCRRLNFHLQEKLIEAESRKQNQAYEIPTTSSMKISTTSNSATTPKKIEPVPSTSNSPPLSHVMEVEEELENMPPKENSQEMQPSMNTDNNNEGYCFYEGRILSADVMRDLQEMRKGPQGDSLFVKKVAVLAWGSEYLMRHSVSGRADPKRGNKAMSEKRPSLDKSRLEAVRNIFIERLRKEGITSPEENERARYSKINRYIGEKIKTLRVNTNGK
ncbi:uncharacterized protein LOC124168944 [Ischnura elegans]|uniref:uncharacterized protein LOC124153411 n=1 Tax=Ischnura elegans TaxID=197161 RepID=UPI001ED89565|nr:uncharacterized protein LOC124153411 [Ischnura elegans]XP_046400423.1 uncharacterized protein LOC124166788 [Ischnura elegans]XP_046403317.1 uncharacterized protein LOC124168944 [Ischnura elegans]